MTPQRVERWVNLYWENGAPCLGLKGDHVRVHDSRNQANAAASSGRIACLKIVVTTELE